MTAKNNSPITTIENNELYRIADQIIGAAIEVHKNLGPGLYEGVYEECLCHELKSRGVMLERQKYMPVIYKEKVFDYGFRADLIVADKVIVELKSVAD